MPIKEILSPNGDNHLTIEDINNKDIEAKSMPDFLTQLKKNNIDTIYSWPHETTENQTPIRLTRLTALNNEKKVCTICIPNTKNTNPQDHSDLIARYVKEQVSEDIKIITPSTLQKERARKHPQITTVWKR